MAMVIDYLPHRFGAIDTVYSTINESKRIAS